MTVASRKTRFLLHVRIKQRLSVQDKQDGLFTATIIIAQQNVERLIMNHKLTGDDVLNYRHERKLTKGDIKCAFFNAAVLLLAAGVVVGWIILATN